MLIEVRASFKNLQVYLLDDHTRGLATLEVHVIEIQVDVIEIEVDCIEIDKAEKGSEKHY